MKGSTFDSSIEKRRVKPKYNVGNVVYFNKSRNIVGFNCNGVGYQCKSNKEYKCGESIRFSLDNGLIQLK